MKAQVKLGRLFGIEIGLHYSWFVIALLIVFSLVSYFRETNPNWGNAVSWISAVATGLLFFSSLLAHEMAHSLVAKSHGIGVRSITLFALGGVSQIEKEAGDPKTEFWIGIVGPLSSIAIGIFFLAGAVLLGWSPAKPPETPPIAILAWLGYINIGLAIFNLIPGFPLDGGRILRAIIWRIKGSAELSTRSAAQVGRVIAIFMIVFGILRLFSGGGFSGLWISFIGWFLLDAAGASYAQAEFQTVLRGARVRDAMTRDCPTVDGNTNLQTFTEDFLLRTAQRCFVVAENGVVAGIITPNEVKLVEQPRRRFTLVSEVMRPLGELRTVTQDTPMSEVLETMAREDLNQLPVIADGRLEGIISRSDVLQCLQTRIELNSK